MIYKLFLSFIISMAAAYAYNVHTKARISMSIENKHLTKAFGIIGVGVSLLGSSSLTLPSSVFADGANSISTVYRARNFYGPKILQLEEAVSKGDLSTFQDSKTAAIFKLFISESTSRNSIKDQQLRTTETKLQEDIFAAAAAKDTAKVKSALSEFVKVADLKTEFKLADKGMSDSSGFGPTYGTERGFTGKGIYDRK